MSRIDNLYVGQRAKESVVVTEQTIVDMAEVSNDYNPIHTSDDYAGKTPFRKRIAHGLVCEALISNVIGNQLPGPGAIFTSIRIDFKKPVFIGDIITATAEIKEIDYKRGLLVINVPCYNQNGDVVVESVSNVKYYDIEK